MSRKTDPVQTSLFPQGINWHSERCRPCNPAEVRWSRPSDVLGRCSLPNPGTDAFIAVHSGKTRDVNSENTTELLPGHWRPRRGAQEAELSLGNRCLISFGERVLHKIFTRVPVMQWEVFKWLEATKVCLLVPFGLAHGEAKLVSNSMTQALPKHGSRTIYARISWGG